ncbi:glutaryl-CoA dehydrogenase [Microbacterium sp. Root61]|uniref:acyl-CoA dehydrogenase family protein n=1 Tax=Microbacterium sp. Root61 TaxID=1736570 RepID=UPI0006FAA697|nr:acyl-CoA dehydrogenase family protein [Microbacterium sp. Root61]KRA25453.1 glutaryl-CoA dehydrogenase [Microbacterium sp. Root61]
MDLISDAYGFAEHLSPAARGVLADLDDTLTRDIRPVLTDAWERAELPDAFGDALIPLDLMDPVELRGTGEADTTLFAGFRNFVLARTDASLATWYNAQSGLFRTTVGIGGSAAQAARLDPLIRSFTLKGTFALTEPEHGSDIAGGLATTARRDGDTWVLDGEKRWIGGAFGADVIAVFARDIADGQIKAFLVARDAPGMTLEKIPHKTSLRIMQNAVITIDGVRVDEADRLQNINSFRDVGGLLRRMRSDVAWIATGVQAGAFEAALRYVTEREQFGRPLGGFQLVQEKLARMLGNVTASLGMVVQLSRRQDAGHYRDEDSSLAKMWTSLRARETVALAREVVGGNGIVLENDVARFFADAEAVYSYEGTHEINALIVGRSLTGRSAFL